LNAQPVQWPPPGGRDKLAPLIARGRGRMIWPA
jgi:hypothetical protein